MKVQTIQSTTEEHTEDGLLYCFPLFAVADGVSGVYYPGGKRETPQDFDGLTGGQKAVELLFQALNYDLHEPLEGRIRCANHLIGTENLRRGILLKEPENLASTVFVAAEEREGMVEIVQMGDCMAVWEDTTGDIGFTENLCFEEDTQRRERIAQLMKKHQSDREEMWREFGPWLVESRRGTTNEVYGVLNGQSKANNFIRTIQIPTPSLLILFTDGLVNYDLTGKPKELAYTVLSQYKEKGLNGILESTRGEEEKKKAESHVDHEEASAIAVEF